jgi:hypothetical protein
MGSRATTVPDRFLRVVAVMSDAAEAGLTRIGFVTDPRPSH